MDFITHWLGRLLTSLDTQLGNEQKAALLAECSSWCTGEWAARAAEIRQRAPDATDTRALLDAFRAALPGGGPDVSVEADTIRWSFAPERCPCPIGQATGNPAVCLCGTAHVRGMLEPLLGRPLEVTLLQSLLRGGDRCAFTVRPCESAASA